MECTSNYNAPVGRARVTGRVVAAERCHTSPASVRGPSGFPHDRPGPVVLVCPTRKSAYVCV